MNSLFQKFLVSGNLLLLSALSALVVKKKFRLPGFCKIDNPAPYSSYLVFVCCD